MSLFSRSMLKPLVAVVALHAALSGGCLEVKRPRVEPVVSDVGIVVEPEAARDPVDLDSSPYPTFAPDPAVKGVVRCVGSSSVGSILNAMRSDFAQAEPDIELRVISSGSSEAPKALASGEADLAPMSRAMRPDEIALVEKARGCKVESIDIAIDAIAICVFHLNPITQLSMKDVDRIFGRERRRGGAPAMTWGDLGVRDPAWTNGKLVLFGMGPKTGSHGIMQEIVLKGGAFRTSVNEEPVASSVVQAIATNASAIGYCSEYFVERAPRARAVLLEATDGSGFIAPTDEAIRSGRYPLSRSLRIYFVRDPKRPNPAAIQFLRFILSDDGQWVVGELGQRRISPEQAHAAFRMLAN